MRLANSQLGGFSTLLFKNRISDECLIKGDVRTNPLIHGRPDFPSTQLLMVRIEDCCHTSGLRAVFDRGP